MINCVCTGSYSKIGERKSYINKGKKEGHIEVEDCIRVN